MSSHTIALFYLKYTVFNRSLINKKKELLIVDIQTHQYSILLSR